MRILAAATIGLAGFAASAQTANACDLEGLGFTRINPFAQHAAWAVPADKNAPPADQRAAASEQQTTEQSEQARAENAQKSSASPAFTPVSADASASQSQRFTATKD